MIARFFDYFGFVGTLSILLWIAAVAVAGHYIFRERHRFLPRIGLGLALLGLLCAFQRSELISEMQVDRSGEQRAQEEKIKAETVAAMKKRAADIHFAEDTATDSLDLAGASQSELQKLGGGAASQPTDYAYRQQGKQERVTGKERAREFADASDKAATQPGAAGTQPSTQPSSFSDRVWPEAQVIEANWLDSWNLFFSRWIFRGLILLALFDYLRRFSATFDVLLPWPLVHLVSDRLFRKAPAVYVRTTGGATSQNEGVPPEALPRAYLERAIHKGETFIYLGSADPWGGAATLSRGLLPQSFGKFDKLTLDLAAAPHSGQPGLVSSPAFAFNATWFARACVVVTQPASAEAMLRHIVDRLENYPAQHAPADQTVNLVLEGITLPPADLLRRVATLAQARNYRLVIFSPEPMPAPLGDIFAERYDTLPAVPFKVPKAEQYLPKVDRFIAKASAIAGRGWWAFVALVDKVMAAITKPIERRERELAAAEAKGAAAEKASD